MTARPEPLDRLDRILNAAMIAHETVFELNRVLVGLGVEDERGRELVAESARLVLDELPAVTAPIRQLAERWQEQSVLAPDEAERTLALIENELERIAPALDELRRRRRAIVQALRDRVARERER